MKATFWTLFMFLLINLGTAADVNAQLKRKVSKNSMGKGALFLYWGYNHSVYTKSNMHFIGPGYDFTLAGVSASDRPSYDIATYFKPTTFTVPQFNIRAGYFFADNWAINFGYDHMKYVMRNNNQVLLSGQINSTVGSEWDGTHINEPVVTKTDKFHYENTDGHNYIHAELMYGVYLYRTKNKKFAITGQLGVGAGGILSFNDFTFAGKKDVKTISMSGYGLSAQAGMRLEFFNHLFIQGEVSGGFMHQVKVVNRPDIVNAYTKHAFGYAMGQVSIGGMIYIRSKNDCNSCPKW